MMNNGMKTAINMTMECSGPRWASEGSSSKSTSGMTARVSTNGMLMLTFRGFEESLAKM